MPLNNIGGAYEFSQVDGNHIYAREGASLLIFDATDSENIHLESKILLGGILQDCLISSGSQYAYAIYRTPGISNFKNIMALQIVEIANKAAPKLRGHLHFDGYYDHSHAMAMKDSGTLLYAGTYNGLCMIDVSNPDLPRQVYQMPGNFCGVQSQGTHLYLPEVGIGLNIYEYNALTTPTLIGTYPCLPYQFPGLSGSLAVLLDGSAGGLRLLDVSTPTSCSTRSVLGKINSLEAISMSGPVLSMIDLSSTQSTVLQRYDLTNPASPALVSSTTLALQRCIRCSLSSSQSIACISLDDGYERLEKKYQFYDFAVPSQPKLAGNYKIPLSGGLLGVSGSILYVLGGDLQVFNIEDPGHPVYLGSTPTSGYCHGFAVQGPLVAMATSGIYNGVQIFDCTNPSAPFLAGRYPSESKDGAGEIAFYKNSLLMTDLYACVKVVNLDDPSSPTTAARYNIPAWGLRLGGDHAIVGSTPYHIVNLKDSTCVESDIPISSAYWGHNFPWPYFPILDESKLSILDFRNERMPRVIGEVPCSRSSDLLVANGTALYVSGNDHRLNAFDMAYPRAPQFKGQAELPALIGELVTSGPYLYMSAKDRGGILIYKDLEWQARSGSKSWNAYP